MKIKKRSVGRHETGGDGKGKALLNKDITSDGREIRKIRGKTIAGEKVRCRQIDSQEERPTEGRLAGGSAPIRYPGWIPSAQGGRERLDLENKPKRKEEATSGRTGWWSLLGLGLASLRGVDRPAARAVRLAEPWSVTGDPGLTETTPRTQAGPAPKGRFPRHLPRPLHPRNSNVPLGGIRTRMEDERSGKGEVGVGKRRYRAEGPDRAFWYRCGSHNLNPWRRHPVRGQIPTPKGRFPTIQGTYSIAWSPPNPNPTTDGDRCRYICQARNYRPGRSPTRVGGTVGKTPEDGSRRERRDGLMFSWSGSGPVRAKFGERERRT